MPLLGFDEFLTAEDEFAYRPAGGKPGTHLSFYPSAEESQYSRHQTGLQHLAFIMRTRSLVNEVHALIADLIPQFGGQVLHQTAGFPQYLHIFRRNRGGLFLE